MKVARGVALGLLCGCVQITLPPCSSSAECLAHPSGEFCTCEDGYCFKFGCPAPQPGVDATQDTGPGDGLSPDALAACPPDAAPASGDGCCPVELMERELDNDCAVVSGQVLQGFAHPAALGGAGVVVVVHATETGDAKLTRLDESLQPVGGPIELLAPLSQCSPPVALPDGTVGLVTAAGLHHVTPNAEVLPAPMPGSAGAQLVAPIPIDDQNWLMVDHLGRLMRTSPAGTVEDGVTLPSPTVGGLGVTSDRSLLAATSGGALAVIDRTQKAVLEQTGDAFVGHPAWESASTAYAVTADGRLGGLIFQSGNWVPLIETNVGAAPLAPVVGADHTTYVASATDRTVTATRWVGEAPAPHWQVNGLPESIVTPPTVGPDGWVYVGLADGTLAALSASGLEWTYRLSGKPNGAPLVFDDGAVLHVASGGRVARVLGEPRPALPWPRLRANPASTATAQ